MSLEHRTDFPRFLQIISNNYLLLLLCASVDQFSRLCIQRCYVPGPQVVRLNHWLCLVINMAGPIGF